VNDTTRRFEEALKYDERIWRAYQCLKTCHREGFVDALAKAADEDYDQLRTDRQRFYDNWKEVEADLEARKAELAEAHEALTAARAEVADLQSRLDDVCERCQEQCEHRAADAAEESGDE
jgi:chromosome segregation ATPase